MPRCFVQVVAVLAAVSVFAVPVVARAGELAAPPLETAEEARPASSPDPAPAAAAAEVPLSRVTLNDGQNIRGRIVEESADNVTLELVNGGRMQLARRGIRDIKIEEGVQVSSTGQLWFRDANRTRYFYSPSAMMLRKGEGYFSQKELLFSSVAYGLTDNVTVLAGSMLPLWLIGTNGFNFIGGIKVGGSITDTFHLAGGAETMFVPSFGGFGFGFVFGGATLGDADRHVTVNVGKPFSLGNSGSYLGDALATVNGNLRLGSHFALVTENWLMPSFFTSTPRLFMINSFGGRIMGERWAVDLAVIRIDGFNSNGGFIPLPWVDFTLNFG